MKVPLLLNYAQCKLIQKEYYLVIEHCTTVLKIEPGLYYLFIQILKEEIIQLKIYLTNSC